MEHMGPVQLEELRMLAHNTLLEEELLAIVRVLAEQHIDVIILKGLPLLERTGGRIEARRIADNDILVRSADAERVARALLELGYHSPLLRTLAADLKDDFQHPLFRNPGRGAPFIVELHWNAFPLYLGVSEAVLWENREIWRQRETELSVFNKELSLLHLASHYVQHLGMELRILEDFARSYEAWQSELEFSKLAQLMLATHTENIFPYCLHLAWAQGLLKSPPEIPLGARAAGMLRWMPGPLEADAHGSEAYRRSLLVWWFVAPRALPKLILKSAFPSVGKMAHRHQEARRSRLLLLYLGRPLRPFQRMAALWTKKPAAVLSARRTPLPRR